MRKWFFLCCLVPVALWAAPLEEELLNPVAVAEHSEKKAQTLDGSKAAPAAGVDLILSGKEELKPVDVREFRIRLRDGFRSIGNWFRVEGKSILRFLIGSLGLLAAGWGLSVLIRRWCGKNKNPDGSLSPRREMVLALLTPFLSLCVLGGMFLLLLPVVEAIPGVYSIDARVVFTVEVLIAAWAGFRVIDLLSARMMRRLTQLDQHHDVLLVDVPRKIMKICIALVALFFVARNIFNLNVSTMLAGAGVVGLAVAIASKETLSNFFGTLVIIMDHPFRTGDRIRSNGIDGLVEYIGIRSTRIRTGDESIFIIPNSTVAESLIENISTNGVIRFAFTVGLDYNTPPEQVEQSMAILHEIVDNFHGDDTVARQPRVFFNQLGDSAMNIRVIMWLKTTNFTTEEKWRTAINLAIVRKFNAAAINMAFNTTTTYVRGETAYPVQFHAAAPEVVKTAEDTGTK